jgi:heterogeneous nuclear ribonucleoprotein R
MATSLSGVKEALSALDISDKDKSDHEKLLEYGLDIKVADKLYEIYKTEKLSHADLDERALDALKEFPVEGALAVLKQFLESNLEHVSNKSAYLCGVMKTYRQKSRAGGAAGSNGSQQQGPDEEKIRAILERTGYTLDVTTGQRKYGGPPPNWDGSPPGNGCEVFCGKIPKDMYEDELIPHFEKCGRIWDLRLMMDPMSGLNRGYAFITFTTRDEALEAVKQLNTLEIVSGKTLKVNVSVPNTRLFVGNIPKSKSKEDIINEFDKLSAGLVEVIIYSSPDDKKKNRGFCFLEYESHKAASLAKRRLGTGRIKVWSCDIIVDWADPQEEPDQDTMSRVKVLYCRNLTSAVTEESLRETFERYGRVERVKKIKDYAFVHFEEREQAVQAMEALSGEDLLGAKLEISLAKPPSDKKKKEEMLRKREQRMMQAMAESMTFPPFPPFPAYTVYGGGRGRGGNLRGGGRDQYGGWQWGWGGGGGGSAGDGQWQGQGGRGGAPWHGGGVGGGPGYEGWGHPPSSQGGRGWTGHGGRGGAGGPSGRGQQGGPSVRPSKTTA